jgi:hypothetical protein
MRRKIFIPICTFLISGIFSSFAQNSLIDRSDPSFFPIAVWAQNPKNAAAYKENGINMYVSIHGGIDQEKLDFLKAADMKVITHQNDFGRMNLDEPLICGWMHGDEPDNARLNKTTNSYDPCIDPAKIIADYKKLKESDPSRPVYMNLGRGVAVTNWAGRGTCRGKTDMYRISNDGYLKGCDIASFDVYPVNSREEDVKDSLWYVAKGIDNLLEWSDYSKPVWCWIETTKISERAERKPTPAEVKSEVWMALIHGASGFGYFCHSFHPSTVDAALLHDKEMIEGVKAINEQVTSLAEVLNSPTTSGYATVKSSVSSIPVDIMTKKHQDDNYIFAVSMRPGRTQAVFHVQEGKKVEVIGENRKIRIKKGKFTDDFSGYAVHLYKVK